LGVFAVGIGCICGRYWVYLRSVLGVFAVGIRGWKAVCELGCS
jgi:hypothetical protein